MKNLLITSAIVLGLTGGLAVAQQAMTSTEDAQVTQNQDASNEDNHWLAWFGMGGDGDCDGKGKKGKRDRSHDRTMEETGDDAADT